MREPWPIGNTAVHAAGWRQRCACSVYMYLSNLVPSGVAVGSGEHFAVPPVAWAGGTLWRAFAPGVRHDTVL